MEHPKCLRLFPSKDHAIWGPSPSGRRRGSWPSRRPGNVSGSSSRPTSATGPLGAPSPELRLGVGVYGLVGLDPDQLSLQAPFPEGLAAPMAGSPMARQLAPGGFMLRSGRPACGPVSLLAQESGRPQFWPESALLFSGWPQDIFGLIFLRQSFRPDLSRRHRLSLTEKSLETRQELTAKS